MSYMPSLYIYKPLLQFNARMLLPGDCRLHHHNYARGKIQKLKHSSYQVAYYNNLVGGCTFNSLPGAKILLEYKSFSILNLVYRLPYATTIQYISG